MGRLDGHLPTLCMIGLQFHYAMVTMLTRAAMFGGLSPTVYVAYRQGIAALTLAPMALSPKRRQSLKISLRLRSFLLIFATALIGVTTNQITYYIGLYYASSTAATAMSNLIPALTFVLATIVGLEKVDPRSLRSIAKIMGTICCVSGALTMAFLKGPKLLHMELLPSKHLIASGGDENWLLGCLLLLASSAFWACWIILQVPISNSSCPDHFISTFWMCLYSMIQSGIFALLYEKNLKSWILHSPLEFLCCLYAGVGIAASFLCQTWCISERGPLHCALFNPLQTVITALIATLFLQEKLYVGSLIGAIGVITGLYIVLWGKAKEYEGVKKQAPHSNMEDDEKSSRIDLEEPLLSEKPEGVAKSKMES